MKRLLNMDFGLRFLVFVLIGIDVVLKLVGLTGLSLNPLRV